ncbi:MAG: phasin family protein [Alphaproteobacteria bacterium]|nr:phasin family protein [Alphaproteobacteria bacterium]
MAQKKNTKSKASNAKKAVKKAQPKAAKTTAETAKQAVSNTQKRVQEQPLKMETTMAQTTKQFEEFLKGSNTASRESYEAFVKSGTIFAKGFEEIVRASMQLAQDSAQKQTQYMKEVLGVKTLNEFTETQNKIAQANFDDFMSNATKISEMSVKLLTEASEPINEQVAKTSQSMAA